MRKDGKKNNRAEELGHLYAKHILDLDDEVKHLVKGKGFFSSFTSGMKKAMKVLPAAVATAGAITGQPEIVAPALALHAAVNGKGKANLLDQFITTHNKRAGSGKAPKHVSGRSAPFNVPTSAKLKPKKKRVVSDKMKRRNALVRKLMKENKMSLAQASKHIKLNNLKY